MKLEQAFVSLQEKNPYWSSIICFTNLITGKGLGKMAIGQAFKKCVEKSDYEGKDKDRILDWLGRL